jgi:hypothetical protein
LCSLSRSCLYSIAPVQVIACLRPAIIWS